MQKTLLAIVAAAVVSVGLSVNFALGAGGEPADKASVTANNVSVSGPGTEVILLDTSMRNSSVADVTFAVTLECAITTTLTTIGNQTANAEGLINVWVEVDGNPVPVAGTDDGQVTFCNEAHTRTTSNFDDGNAQIDTFHRSKQANGFNWTKINMGNGIHDIKVYGTLTETATNGTADAVIGRRTLTVDQTKMAVNETNTANDD